MDGFCLKVVVQLIQSSLQSSAVIACLLLKNNRLFGESSSQNFRRISFGVRSGEEDMNPGSQRADSSHSCIIVKPYSDKRSPAKKESSLCPWESSGYKRKKEGDNIRWEFSFLRSISLCFGNSFTNDNRLRAYCFQCLSRSCLNFLSQYISVMIQGALHFISWFIFFWRSHSVLNVQLASWFLFK